MIVLLNLLMYFRLSRDVYNMYDEAEETSRMANHVSLKQEPSARPGREVAETSEQMFRTEQRSWRREGEYLRHPGVGHTMDGWGCSIWALVLRMSPSLRDSINSTTLRPSLHQLYQPHQNLLS